MNEQFKLHWSSYAQDKGFYSIPQYVELNAEILKTKYLEFIHEIGVSVINGKSIIDHLELVPGLSLWWTTLLSEKSLYKSPYIEDCIKMFALEKVLINDNYSSIVFYGVNDLRVRDSIKILCKNYSVKVIFDSQYDSESSKNSIYKKIYHPFLFVLTGLFFLLRYTVTRWKFKEQKYKKQFYGDNSVCFFSYFINLSESNLKDDIFYSRQWGELPNKLKDFGIRSNWIHHFSSHDLVQDINTGMKHLSRINSNSKSQGFHYFLDGYVSLSMIWRVIVNWFKLFFVCQRLGSVESIFTSSNSKVSLFPILKRDWYRSVYGITAVQNLLWVELFDHILKRIPKQKTALYLYEGQGWESILIHFWKKHNHGRLIAVQHTTVNFWDLRFSNLVKINKDDKQNLRPEPDLIAVNGKSSFVSLSNFSHSKLIEVEALRYIPLLKIIESSKKFEKSNPKIIRLLVLGDSSERPTKQMMLLLQSLSESFLERVSISVKPYPSNQIKKSDYPKIDFKLLHSPLNEILHGFDVVYGVNSTTANLDAYLCGLRVMVYVPDGELIISPLRGFDDVDFINNKKDLRVSLSKINSRKYRFNNEFFWMDRTLPKWKKLIKSVIC